MGCLHSTNREHQYAVRDHFSPIPLAFHQSRYQQGRTDELLARLALLTLQRHQDHRVRPRQRHSSLPRNYDSDDALNLSRVSSSSAPQEPSACACDCRPCRSRNHQGKPRAIHALALTERRQILPGQFQIHRHPGQCLRSRVSFRQRAFPGARGVVVDDRGEPRHDSGAACTPSHDGDRDLVCDRESKVEGSNLPR
ncbi:hypothetical protein BJ742DRAFT_824582 [Cladochytrium replicatum]|nr:hypothetical protein BJ742DRAFT_824582 [Cladochytrium replicatum]